MRKEDVEAQKRGGTSAPSEGGVDGSAGGSRSGQGAKEAGSGSGSSGQKGGQSEVKEGTVEDLHDLPPRFWKTATLVMDDAEMEAVMVSLQTSGRSHAGGGATTLTPLHLHPLRALSSRAEELLCHSEPKRHSRASNFRDEPSIIERI